MSLPRFAMQYKVVVMALTGLMLVLGTVQIYTMPRRADPEFTIPVCQVITRWPGVETERVEQLVTHPLEEEINTLGEVKHIRSTTTTGLSVIEVELEESVEPTVIPQIWDRVRAKVGNVRSELPTGVMDPIVNDDFGDTAVMLLAVYEKQSLEPADSSKDEETQPTTNRSYTDRQLEVIADRLRERLASMPGVARAEMHGTQQEAIYIETSRGIWSNLDATTIDVERLLQARNIFVSGGSIETALSRFGIQPTGALDAVAQIKGMVIGRDESGAPIYLRDLGVHVRRS
ncbi:MAG: efflux RND transporter permease subunit, partial [Bythopirellula sp.]